MMDLPLKLGILYLQSSQYSAISQDFIRGIKLNNLPVQYYMESIDIGTNDRQVIEKIQKLNFQEEISLIIAFLGHYNTKNIYSYAEDNNIILIVSNLGANIPYKLEKHKGVYINSYGLNEACYSLGKYFAQQGMKNIVSSSSYYDAGYGILEAIEMGLKEKQMNFLGHYITPFNPRENEAEIMQQVIQNHEAKTVFAFYSGIFAEEHVDFIQQTNLLDNTEYYFTPFSIKKNLPLNNTSQFYIIGSWIENEENSEDDFIKNYKKTYDEEHPTIFAMLGYENGLIIKKIYNSKRRLSQSDICTTIENLSIDGPRGSIFFNQNTNHTVFNHYIYEISINENQKKSIKKSRILKNEGCFFERAMCMEQTNQTGGWQNAYLCH